MPRRRSTVRAWSDCVADFETFCNCDYETPDGKLCCVCMNRLPPSTLNRSCDPCKAGTHRLVDPMAVCDANEWAFERTS